MDETKKKNTVYSFQCLIRRRVPCGVLRNYPQGRIYAYALRPSLSRHGRDVDDDGCIEYLSTTHFEDQNFYPRHVEMSRPNKSSRTNDAAINSLYA